MRIINCLGLRLTSVRLNGMGMCLIHLQVSAVVDGDGTVCTPDCNHGAAMAGEDRKQVEVILVT